MSSTPSPLRFLILQVIKPTGDDAASLRELDEAEQLVETLGGVVAGRSIQHRDAPHPATYIGGGKIAWLQEKIRSEMIDVVVLNDIVRTGQIFRLEKELWEANRTIQVWDRVGLILNIFDLHAKTAEAKLQIELARITTIGARIYGLGGTVLSKQGAGIGTRGAGESNSEMERRIMKRRVQEIRKALSDRSKMTSMRIHERKRRGVQTVALVGYTSAGKTTLFNLLTGKEKEMHAGLFTTLDSVVGKLKNQRKEIIVSDTIGFIGNLPPSLVDAFRSTLLESIEADVVLHVVDASDEARQEKIAIVEGILTSLHVSVTPILVLSKIDRLSSEQFLALQQEYIGRHCIFVSASTGEGIEELHRRIFDILRSSSV